MHELSSTAQTYVFTVYDQNNVNAHSIHTCMCMEIFVKQQKVINFATSDLLDFKKYHCIVVKSRKLKRNTVFIHR